MKFSIITISYNQAEFLERTILSVLEQKKDVDLEYIICDPGSTDGSREIIEKYQNQIDKIIYDKDEGPADGLNVGFSHATGEIGGFLNSDDILYPNALLNIQRAFETNNYIDVISGNSKLIDENDRVLRLLYSDKFNLFMSAYKASILIQPSTFFKMSAFKKAKGFNKNNRTNWDGELFIDMGLSGAKFSNINQVLSGYRVYSTSITGSMKDKDKYEEYGKYIYKKIMKREFKSYNKVIKIGASFLRKILNFKDTIERVKGGSAFGRGVQS